MKKVILSLVFASAALLTGCIKETVPTSMATFEQAGASASALEATVAAIPAQMIQGYLVYGQQEWEFDMAYPGMMIIRDSVTGEIVDAGDTGYDWYSYWSSNDYTLGVNTARAYCPWRTYYMFVKSANDVIAAIDEASASEAQLAYLAYAKAYRALFYLDMVRMYEFKAPTDPAVSASYKPEKDLTGLAVPIITEATTQDQAKANPRATVDAVYDLIFSDLDAAQKYSPESAACAILPSKAVIYGLKARAYLERGSAGKANAFDSAAVYADKAITAFGGSFLTQTQWEDPTTGLNNAEANKNSWMWYIRYSDSNMGNLCNFVAHMSAECDWTAYGWGVGRGVPRNLYEKIPDADFRKHSWYDPDGSKYYDYQINSQKFIKKGYASLKFRPAQGDYKTYKVGGASDVPLMRLEEMYLIKAEAQAMAGDLAAGKATLETLIKSRNKGYSCSASTASDFQKEVYFQKRVELWGEGLIFFDAKRLGMGFTNGYTGTNAQEGYRWNVTGVSPSWNFCIPQSELNGNPVLDGYNNPEPAKTLTEWSE